MKRLMLSLFAGLVVLASASIAYAGFIGDNYVDTDPGRIHSLQAVDTAGITVVEINKPSMPLAAKPGVWYKANEGFIVSEGKTFLDSNSLWAVADIRVIPFEGTTMMASDKDVEAAEMKLDIFKAPRLYCLDTVSKSCGPSLYLY